MIDLSSFCFIDKKHIRSLKRLFSYTQSYYHFRLIKKKAFIDSTFVYFFQKQLKKSVFGIENPLFLVVDHFLDLG